MLTTPFLKWPYPEDNDDPYFEVIDGLFKAQDDSVFGLLNTAGNIIIPPSSVLWNSGTSTLTWNNDFEIPIMSVGFSLSVQFGPDNVNRSATLQDGDRMIVTVPRTSTGAVSANFGVVNGAVSLVSGLFTVGFRRGSRFYANFPQIFT